MHWWHYLHSVALQGNVGLDGRIYNARPKILRDAVNLSVARTHEPGSKLGRIMIGYRLLILINPRSQLLARVQRWLLQQSRAHVVLIVTIYHCCCCDRGCFAVAATAHDVVVVVHRGALPPRLDHRLGAASGSCGLATTLLRRLPLSILLILVILLFGGNGPLATAAAWPVLPSLPVVHLLVGRSGADARLLAVARRVVVGAVEEVAPPLRLHRPGLLPVDRARFTNLAKILVRNVVLVQAHAYNVLPDPVKTRETGLNLTQESKAGLISNAIVSIKKLGFPARALLIDIKNALLLRR